MARPVKEGLDYFPFDVDFPDNKKTSAIMGEFGTKGVLTMVYLLSAVYKNGYFLQWDKLTEMQLVNKIDGLTPQMINQIVTRLVAYGTFDEGLFNSVRVLTSQRIQTTYLDATKRRKLQEPLEYAVNVNKNITTAEVNVDINTQSKVKESKLNKSNKDKRPKSKKRIYEPDSDYYKLALSLWEKIKSNNPENKEPNIQTWADDIRKMSEIDHRDKDKIRNMIDWCQTDSFWSSNILSAKKLRDKYETMRAQANQSYKRSRSGKRSSKIEQATDWSTVTSKSTGMDSEQAEKARLDMLEKLRKKGSEVNQ